MTIHTDRAEIQSFGHPSWVGGAAVFGGMAVMAALAVVILMNSSTAMAEQERQMAAEIALENAAFCAKFGAGPETQAFASCTDELRQIRHRHEERTVQPLL